MASHSKALLKLLESSSKGVSSLFLEGAVREVDVGIHPHEVGTPQRVSFDIHVMIEGAEKPPEDSIDQVLDYEYLLAALYRTLEMERPALLETLATRLLDEVLAPAEAVAASVRITKLDALEDGGRLGCSMTRLK